MSIRDQRIVIFSITCMVYYNMLLVVENIDESALNKMTTYIIRLSFLILGC